MVYFRYAIAAVWLILGVRTATSGDSITGGLFLTASLLMFISARKMQRDGATGL